MQGLLALLGKFARMPAYLGGLKDGAICTRSMLLFNELAKRADPPISVSMLLEPCPWRPPRLPVGSWPVTLPLLADCSIDVGRVIAAGGRPGDCQVAQDLAKEWAALSQSKARWPLLGLLLVCIADRLGHIWDEELQGRASKKDLELDLQCVDDGGLTRLEVSGWQARSSAQKGDVGL